MGGTFDPIHNGHLFLAKEIEAKYQLDKIIFVPSKIGPHKIGKVKTSPEMRFQMVQAAIADQASFEVSDIEIRHDGISYSIDTVLALKERYAVDQLFFITGADAILNIESWKNFEELLKQVVFVAASRPTRNKKQTAKEIERILKTYDAKIGIINILGLEISSSDIRSRVEKSMPITYLLPAVVEQMIVDYNLYR